MRLKKQLRILEVGYGVPSSGSDPHLFGFGYHGVLE